MSELVYEQLTLYQEGFLANHSALHPGSAEARMMTVTSGRKCCELLKRSDPLGSLAKMCLESSIWHSTRCFLTWKPQDIGHKSLLFRLAVSMPRTKDTASVLWPTWTRNGAGSEGHRKMLLKMQEKGLITEKERKGLQQGHGGKINPELLEWLMGYEQAFTELIPTPTSSWRKSAAKNRWYGGVLPTQYRRIVGTHPAWENWPDEPGVDRVVDGIPYRVDRIGCLGNAVVPQQFYPFFAAIVRVEEARNGC